MPVQFTPEQQSTITARNSSILVSAAAGSGKTAVLVERIIRMVSDPEHPVDIDRLLVVTFTSAAAAQMRERITQALSRAVEADPGNEHLIRQLTLIHNAQITTIDSFCLYLIRNHFDEIDLDPEFRVPDEGEIRLLRQEVLGQLLEDCHASKEESFLNCVEYFAPNGNEKRLEEQILTLYDFAMSYPWPQEWLAVHREDYSVMDGNLEEMPWVRIMLEYVGNMLCEAVRMLETAEELAMEPDGPYMYIDTIAADREQAERLLELCRFAGAPQTQTAGQQPVSSPNGSAAPMDQLYQAFSHLEFGRISAKKDPSVSPEKRERAKAERDGAKEQLKKLAEKYFYAPFAAQAERMQACAPAVCTLIDLTLDFCARMDAAKREKNLLDFGDMEHMALQILTRKPAPSAQNTEAETELQPSPVALELRQHFAEIMIDEYQDSNLVQEYLLQSISGEEEGRFNRFMVGDVKQSIYKFRLARPELFMEKFDRYQRKENVPERRIDLRKNFRSRSQVTDSVNDVFCRIMGKDLGGVAYDADAALYPGAVYPEPEADRIYQTELLLTVTGEDGLDDKEREAQAVAAKIRSMVGRFPVTDAQTGQLRPANYGDMVILLRTTSGWDEVFKKVLEENGVPVYITSRTGYFAATEVQTVLNFLRILNNPLQDIPLFGVLRSPVADFTDEEIARLRVWENGSAEQGGKEELPGESGIKREGTSRKRRRKLYDSLKSCAESACKENTGQIPNTEITDNITLSRKAARFLTWFTAFRRLTAYLPIRRLIERFLQDTGYLHYAAALPGGEQRRANLEMLLTKAENFEKTSYTGLFHFIRYMEQAEKYEVDYGEASLQDENADTVRIMSIHKSKGLEFPICFVSGLAKRFNMQDTTKPVIMDMDYGIAVDYVNSAWRIKQSTLKKDVLAGKLHQDSLGEELRVLYVAMTRAEEKLILTGNCSGKLAEQVRQREEEYSDGRNEDDQQTENSPDAVFQTKPQLLPFSLRTAASSYLDWILPAWQDCGRNVQLLTTSDLVLDQVQKLQSREELSGRLKILADNQLQMEKEKKMKTETELDAENTGEATSAVFRLQQRMAAPYQHENLRTLYTKTTVSELKIAGMEETAEEAYRMFEQAEPVPYLPAFLRGDEKRSGAARGSAYHKALELFPFECRSSLDRWGKEGGQDTWTNLRREISAAEVRTFLDTCAQTGSLTQEYREAIYPSNLAVFLNSGLAARMEQAAGDGRLYKEQPFVLGLPASELSADYPETETVLIQGIIDVWFEESDGLVVADYKTDAVTEPQELINRYQVQLDYYARALEQLTGKPVKEKIIYSFALKKEIVI